MVRTDLYRDIFVDLAPTCRMALGGLFFHVRSLSDFSVGTHDCSVFTKRDGLAMFRDLFLQHPKTPNVSNAS